MRHAEFILTGLSRLLEEAALAVRNLGAGIDSWPLRDYFLRSLFLKMTGAQEQKCKCICWDLATFDYDFRYQTFSKWSLGECSSLKDKTTVFSGLVLMLEKMGVKNISVNEELVRKGVLCDVKGKVQCFYDECRGLGWPQHEFEEFREVFSKIKATCLVLPTNKEDKSWRIFSMRCDKCERRKTFNYPTGCDKVSDFLPFDLQELYEQSVHRHRNECAHNTLSYQMNKPSFDEMCAEGYEFRNYYLRFAILILIDELFMRTYKEWADIIKARGEV